MTENRLASVKQYLEEVRVELLKLHEEQQDPYRVVLRRTEAIDRLLVRLYAEAEQGFGKGGGRSALVAQGGYGRRELCLKSDIDLLFLHEGTADGFVPFLTEQVLQTLWDAGLEVGFATRTVRDCRRLMDQDLTILNSLADSRFLTGDQRLYDTFAEMLRRYWGSRKNRDRYYLLKMEENEQRARRYGGSVYLLEPNLKEGEGGLRDFHTLYWLCKIWDGVASLPDLARSGRLTPEEFGGVWEAVSFVWSVRNELHRLAGRRQDQLLFEYQGKIAAWLGMKDTEQLLGVEAFLQRYYRHAATLHRIAEKTWGKLRAQEGKLFSGENLPGGGVKIVEGRLTVAGEEYFQEPLGLLRVFEEARRLAVEIDDFAKEKIEKQLSRIDDPFRSDARTGSLFREIVRQPVGLGPLLMRMNETGVLGALLPEFAKLHFRVQHDAYHVYTVDVHSIFAVAELGKLLQGDYDKSHPTFAQVARDIASPGLLAFGILYHDIGKGEGRGHVEKGAPLIRQAAARLGFSPQEQDTLEFLERSHLIMTHLAFRRDLEDPHLIVQFAKSMPSQEHLNMLLVLTFCDVKGVSPEAMTDWKASLLEYLYLRTREVILKGAFTPERISSQLPRIREEVEKRLHGEADRPLLDEFFRVMPPRYFQATAVPQLLRHLRLWKRLSHERIVLETRVLEREGLNEVTLLTLDSPALFSKMTGIFAAHHINILGAELAVTRQGHALHQFRVVDPQGGVIRDDEKWGRVKEDVDAVLSGKLRVEALVADKFRPTLLQKRTARVVPTRIDIDNDVSAYYTLIDVYAHDRVGLLYQITSTLAALGLYVDVSKISTKVDQVADTFYVKDIFGHKITDAARLGRLRELLTVVIDTPPDPGWRPPGLT